MNKQTKMILSILGLGAVVVPAVLLIITSARTKEVPSVPTEDRQIDSRNIEETVRLQIPSPSPGSASSSATPFKTSEGTGSSAP